MLPQVKNALARAAARSGAGLVEVQLPLSRLAGGPAEVAAAFDEALTAGRGRVKLAVIDHIGSFPPYTFPVQRLCSLCKAAGAKGAPNLMRPLLLSSPQSQSQKLLFECIPSYVYRVQLAHASSVCLYTASNSLPETSTSMVFHPLISLHSPALEACCHDNQERHVGRANTAVEKLIVTSKIAKKKIQKR